MLFNNPPLIALRNQFSPYSTGINNRYNYTGLAWLLAAALPFFYIVLHEPEKLLTTFLASLVVLQFWQFLFCTPRLGNIIPNLFTVLSAILFSLLLPLTISIWMLVLCVSFGSVFGERVFGGRGYSFLHPVTVGIAFYLYSQNIDPAATGANLIPFWVVISITLVLVLFQLVSWRTLIGLGIGLIPAYWLINLDDLQALLINSCTLITLLFLGTDPGSGGSTNPARWVHGMLCGLLIALLYSQGTQPLIAVVFAILLASLSVPLIDYVVVQIHTSQRRRRHE